MKKALLFIAHGSRREASNEEVREIARQVSVNVSDDYDYVEAAFLELAQPSIPYALAAAVDEGCEQLFIFPYFLAAGKHVVTDVPELVESFCQQNPHVEVSWLDYLGKQPELVGLLSRAVTKTP